MEAAQPDGHAGCGHGFAAEALEEVIIATAAAERAEVLRDGLEDRAGIIAQPAHDGGIESDAVFVILAGGEEFVHLAQFIDAVIIADDFFGIGASLFPRGLIAHFEESDERVDLRRREACPLSEIAGGVAPSFTEQQADALAAEAIIFIERAHDVSFVRLVIGVDADFVQRAIEDFPIIDADAKGLARDAGLREAVGHEHAHFGIGGGRGSAERIGIDLGKLSEASFAGFFVAQHGSSLIASERLGQGVEVFGDIARERRGQIVAQGELFLAAVLEAEHALMRLFGIGQEGAERIGIFEQAGFERREAVGFADLADAAQDV